MTTSNLCLCGCGAETTQITSSCAKRGLVRGAFRQYVHGHHTKRGQPSSRWNGGITSTVKGYRIRRDDHRFEHIIVVERALGKALRRTATVHHVNEDRADNKPPNLVACDSHSYHMLLHRRQRALDACGNPDWVRCRGCDTYGPLEAMRVLSNGKEGPRYAHHGCPTRRRKGSAV